MSAPTIHASCVLVGACGVLVRGPSGRGKSGFADALVLSAQAHGTFARHVADDRVCLSARGARLVAQPPTALAGLWERRGLGIVAVAHEARAIVRLIVDLVPAETCARLPDPGEDVARLEGIALPRLCIASPPSQLDVARVLRLAAGGERHGVRAPPPA
ncbi:serine/threonine protein kinase [Stappia sp.]|uniref:HPr kinase/phosphorylase n=1 Tax=Stappia sp. TaxID=1870903 RepID=UPI0032D9009D